MSVEAKIRRLEALAASTTFAGERANALAAIERLRPRAPEPVASAIHEAQSADKLRAIQTLQATLLAEVDGEELYWVPGHDAVTERELFELWILWQSGARW